MLTKSWTSVPRIISCDGQDPTKGVELISLRVFGLVTVPCNSDIDYDLIVPFEANFDHAGGSELSRLIYTYTWNSPVATYFVCPGLPSPQPARCGLIQPVTIQEEVYSGRKGTAGC